MTIGFAKYHGLGNDYLVIEESDVPDPAWVSGFARRICERHRGVGADGVLLARARPPGEPPAVRIVNPDGSFAEKSGNGLRIFARHLWESGAVGRGPFEIRLDRQAVTAEVLSEGRQVVVDMGRASFDAWEVPVRGMQGPVLRRSLEVGGEVLEFSAVTVGNPHCVVLGRATKARACRIGPLLERHSHFPNRTNVQLAEVLDRSRVRIEIWERGAGYTLASGSSSCAVAAVTTRLGLTDPEVEIEMPGGCLQIVVSDDFSLRMRGPVVKICSGELAAETLE